MAHDDDDTDNDAAADIPNPPTGDETSSTFNIARYFGYVAGTLTFLAAGLFMAHETHLRALTQYGLVLAAGILIVAQIVQSAKTVRESHEQDAWVLIWLAVAVVCGAMPPSVAVIVPCASLLWLYTFVQCECDTSAIKGGGAPVRCLKKLRAKAKAVVPWRAAKTAFPAAVAFMAALAASAGAFFSTVAEPARSGKSAGQSASANGNKQQPRHQNPSGVPNKGHGSNNAGGSGGSGTEESHESQPAFTCPDPEYPRAPWAVAPIQKLLRSTLRYIGEPVEGCVERLNTEYEDTSSFVWGVGVNPTTKRVLSIVLASAEPYEASLVLDPAVPSVERLIAHYHALSGPTPWPHLEAHEGDLYLLNTPSEGTCILIRDHAGKPEEDLPFTTLYPSVATAWALIVRLTKHWQWPVEQPKLNRAHEVVFKLIEPGTAESDAEITFNPSTLMAEWHGPELYPYTASQGDIDPTEIEKDIRDYH